MKSTDTSSPRERPILFSGPMIRALLAGTKTQTRRIVDKTRLRVRLPCSVYSDVSNVLPCRMASAGVRHASIHDFGAVSVHDDEGNMLGVRPGEFSWVSPYGEAGSATLWVRETWCLGNGLAPVDAPGQLVAPADAPKAPAVLYAADGVKLPPGVPWKPSIFMRRHHCRLLLEVTGVRIERLQAITEEDARAEGVETVSMAEMRRQARFSCRDDYAQLWDLINRKRAPWSSNPLVWVVEFRRRP